MVAWFSVCAIGMVFLGHASVRLRQRAPWMASQLIPPGALLPGVVVDLTAEGGGASKSATSDTNGRFIFLMMPPGKYALHASKPDFEQVSLPEINISL